MIKKILLTSSLIVFSIVGIANAGDNCISKKEVTNAQKKWADGIVKLGKSKNPKEDTVEFINKMYDYNGDGVLFKPTLASDDQFRQTKEEALSYFIGNGSIKEDSGFALTPFKKVVFDNHKILLKCNYALAMGNYYFTSAKDNSKIKVEYSFGYTKDEEGNIKINLQHSSLPYSKK